MSDPVWYPAQGNGSLEGLWYPACTNGENILMGFESAGACMRYLTRSGLAPSGVHMRKGSDEPGVKIYLTKGFSAEEVQRFVTAWNDAKNRHHMIMPGMTETSPAGLDDGTEYGRPPRPGECPHTVSPADACTMCNPPEDGPPDDDRFEWIDVSTPASGQQWIKGRCNHSTPVPIDAYPTGELVRWLCPDCGDEFEPDRWPVPEGMWRRIPVLFEGGPSGSLHKINDQPVLRADDGPCPHHRCDERAYTCACQTCTKCNGKEHTPWWVWTGAGIFVSLYHDLAIDVVWDRIKAVAPWIVFVFPAWAAVIWFVGVVAGWWS